MSEKRVLSRIFGPKKPELLGGWRKFNEDRDRLQTLGNTVLKLWFRKRQKIPCLAGRNVRYI